MTARFGAAPRIVRWLYLAALVLFWVYVATLVLAGFWGLVGARLDFPILLHQQVGSLSPGGSPDVLSQYRFLRGVEAGFGLFAVRFRHEIFTTSVYNQLFLATMSFGIAGRLLGWILDGTPSAPMFLFLGVELVGVACIFAATRPSMLSALNPIEAAPGAGPTG